MKQGVYVDVLLAMNFMVDYLLIATVELLSKANFQRKRMAAAALLGAGSSLSIFLPPLRNFAEIFLQLFMSAMMIRIAEKWGGWKKFIKLWILFFGVSFLYGGIMLAIRQKAQNFIFSSNGIIYFNIKPVVLVMSLGLSFVGVGVFQRIFPSENPQGKIYSAELTVQGEKIFCRAFLDTGNHLTEPFSGYSVVVLEKSCFKGEIDEKNFRFIPCQTIIGKTLLPAVRGEKLRLEGDDSFETERFYVALSEEKICGGKYSLLISAMF